jgi:hypothetical protein
VRPAARTCLCLLASFDILPGLPYPFYFYFFIQIVSLIYIVLSVINLVRETRSAHLLILFGVL